MMENWYNWVPQIILIAGAMLRFERRLAKVEARLGMITLLLLGEKGETE